MLCFHLISKARLVICQVLTHEPFVSILETLSSPQRPCCLLLSLTTDHPGRGKLLTGSSLPEPCSPQARAFGGCHAMTLRFILTGAASHLTFSMQACDYRNRPAHVR